MSTYQMHAGEYKVPVVCAGCGNPIKHLQWFWIDEKDNDPDIPIEKVKFYHRDIYANPMKLCKKLEAK